MRRDIVVTRHRGEQSQATFDNRLLPQQHPPDIRVLDDRHHLAATRAELAPLLAVARIGQ
jgi:hypothetical protein